MNATTRVRNAINATDHEYWLTLLATRAGASGKAQGSVIPDVTQEQLEELLLAAEWQSYDHPNLMEDSVAFTATISGQMGLVNLRDLPGDTLVTLEDPKGTGKVSAVVSGVPEEMVEFTIIILGPDEDSEHNPIPDTETVWTFHPGAPIRPSQINAQGVSGQTVSAEEAITMGFALAKVTSR